MRRLFAGAGCLLALCGCDSAPQNPVDAAIVSPATPPAPLATPPSRVAHEGLRIDQTNVPLAVPHPRRRALAEGRPEDPRGEGISGDCPCRPFRLRDDERPP